ncbi:MAG: hypothetical protein AAF805_10160 [Planctomycetota bacterium]
MPEPASPRLACAFGASLLSGVAALSIGCGGATAPTAPPFLSADRVPPPSTRVVAPDAAVTPYYGPPATSVPPASAWPSAAPPSGAYPAAPPGGATPVYDTPPYQPAGSAAPLGAPPAGPYSASPPLNARTPGPGDTVAVPNDAGALRFASPSEVALARAPIGEAASRLAQTPATASGWIANSAPVRGSTSVAASSLPPRASLPGADRRPVSLARLSPVPGATTQGVPMAPLEPAPASGGAETGGRAPLRIALPSSSTYR